MHDWAGAACVDADPELFFTSSRVVAAQVIGQFCDGCTVRAECLEFAIGHEEARYVYGIYGGYMATARQAMKRRRAS